MSEGRILIADDEKEILDVLEMLLVENGYEVVRASNGRQALEHPSEDIDLYILDVNMPEMSGFAAGSEIRRRSDTPMIFLTAYAGESDKYLGFSAGADDYIVKPFSNTELLMRVKAILRRTMGKADSSVAKGGSDMKTTDGEAVRISGTGETNTAGSTIIYKDLLLDTDSHILRKEDQLIKLTYTEFRILELFLTNRGKIFSPENIYSSVWNEDAVGDETIMVHIKNIRRKLGDSSREPKYVKTAWGRGYYVD